MASRAVGAGILALYFMQVAALRLNADPNKAASFGRTLETGAVPVLSINEAPDFFDAMAKQESTTLAKTHIKGAKATCEPTKLLVVVFGLMRSYKHTWPVVADQLNLKDINQCGGFADVIVNTDLMTRCTGKEFETGRCRDDWQAPSQEQYLKEIQETYQPYLKGVFNTSTMNLERISESLTGVDRLGNVVAKASKTGDVGFLETLAKEINEGKLSRYTHAVAIRADSHFSQPMADLNAICGKYPGFNVIHGDYETPCWIHSRDFDKGFLACGAQLMGTWFNPPKGKCADGNFAPVPADFGGAWFKDGGSCGGGFDETISTDCEALKELHEKNTRVGTLDGDGIFVHVVNGNEY